MRRADMGRVSPSRPMRSLGSPVLFAHFEKCVRSCGRTDGQRAAQPRAHDTSPRRRNAQVRENARACALRCDAARTSGTGSPSAPTRYDLEHLSSAPWRL